MGDAPTDGLRVARARVWIVDDSDLQGEICRRALADVHDVTVFADGANMLEALGSASPEVLVLDWHMPNLSGLDLCRFVRETRDTATLPILIVTATGADDLAEAFAAGANDFVQKPFSPTELAARVGGLVRSKQIHARLAEVEARLRVEGEFRERFIGMLAHDLRQPLNTFVLANQTMASKPTPSVSLGSLLEMQRNAAERMSRMIAELLDFTRIRPETGMPIEPQQTNLEVLVRSVIDEMRVGHPTRSFRLEVQGPCVGHWDPDRLAQVCANLLGNAVEHSPSPFSHIDVEVQGRPEFVELSVSNTGKPIPGDLMPVLFEPFRRGREAGRSSGGLGLGLHIVHEIVRAHGGSVTAESDATATVFRVRLPLGSAVPLAT
jgi:signal transduction histidine kinase